jgi:hypothetical protein
MDELIILFHSQFRPFCVDTLKFSVALERGLLDYNVLKLLQAQWAIK